METNVSERIEADVAIVGAGPAGTAAAARLGQLGVRSVVLVDRADFPRDKTCGSGLSPKGIQVLKELGIWDDVAALAYPINGIRIVTPGGQESFQSAGTEAQAVVCHRRVLDHALLKRAQSRGTRFIPHFSATNTLEEGGRTVGFVDREGREVRAKFTFVAGGSHCRVGVQPRPTRKVIQAIMGWWDGVPFTPHHVEMIFDDLVVPYYGWLFPEGGERVNIGITYEDDQHEKNARELFQRFLDKHYAARLRGAHQVGGWKGHPVMYSYDIRDLTAPGKVIIGEAGLMTHPATAEGIYQGMKSGMMAAEAVADVLSFRKSEAEALGEYEARCKRTFQASFLAGRAFRRAVKTPILDWMVGVGNHKLVKSTTARLMAAI